MLRLKMARAMLEEAEIRRVAASLGIPIIGFTEATPLLEIKPHLEARHTTNGPTPFVGVSPDKRVDYRQAYGDVAAVIVIGLPYTLKMSPPKSTQGKGRLSAFCRGEDYHLRLSRTMEALMVALKANHPQLDYRLFVDNGKLVDRGSAWRAGLGFYGKNNTLIHPQYGSGVFIGQILVNTPIAFVPVTPLKSQCGSCRRCLDACPQGALKSGFSLDASRCISYLTQKKKLSEEEEQRVQYFVYGCDLCQLACPYNAHLPEVRWEDGPLNAAWPELQALSEMDEATFDAAFAGSALHWRGCQTLVRNSKLLLKFQEKEC
ncbi:tRNA epoxyqueuosine(34) reductase QueG [Eubacterium aggregans]|uniref:Epoxyqueuosine reductase n=2 Tax=Eubacterium aggregans TaxID=81409 RepID=A0A1H4A4Z4_9FIRM|nr:tRNA epoxyqueuosine(34) reductase QueG [Eubacterium aggregans]SEA31035.1 epoxyqueuosine reductase [Eubacterium aggregans]